MLTLVEVRRITLANLLDNTSVINNRSIIEVDVTRALRELLELGIDGSALARSRST